MLSLWRGRQCSIHAEDEVLALQVMQEAILGDGGNADAPDASAASDMGTCDLPDRVVIEWHFRSEVERDAWHFVSIGMASRASRAGHDGGGKPDPIRCG